MKTLETLFKHSLIDLHALCMVKTMRSFEFPCAIMPDKGWGVLVCACQTGNT